MRAGDVVAELSALELTAAVAQARAALAAATASRDHVYAGVRAEEIAGLAAEIAQGEIAARLCGGAARARRLPGAQRLSPRSRRSIRPRHDVATARADVAEAEANHAAAVAGPTNEERAIADAQVQAAAAALAVLERRLDKTVLRAPADGVVSVIVAEIGENVRAGQPVLAIEATGKRWLSFNAREDTCAVSPLGRRSASHDRWRRARRRRPSSPRCCRSAPFATWQAERAVGDHDRNTLRLRLDPQRDADRPSSPA